MSRLNRNELTPTVLLEYGHVLRDSTDCVKWTAARTKAGYGVINIRGEKTQYAHRLMYELLHGGDMPEYVMHTCDTPMCIFGSHLVGGTAADNAQDMAQKGRARNSKRRPTWDETWMSVAATVSRRSRCERRQAGCVIASKENRICGTGYNGPPQGFPIDGLCSAFCARAICGAKYPLLYSDCPSIHAETNALMHTDRAMREDGTLYVNTAPCFDCGKAIANSGVSRVLFRVDSRDAYREPQRTIDFMMQCSLHVEIVL